MLGLAYIFLAFLFAYICWIVIDWDNISVGTKSVLIGAHCFFLHPFFLARAWWKLYGFPWDPRLWVAFFVHDIGYIGKPNMDGVEGESHPEVGARIMRRLFDNPAKVVKLGWGSGTYWLPATTKWYEFVLYHSRHYAKAHNKPFSRLCVADKLVFCIEPRWLYLFRVKLTGELAEFLENAKYGRGEVINSTPEIWHDTLKAHMRKWVEAHKNGEQDNWTEIRHQRAA